MKQILLSAGLLISFYTGFSQIGGNVVESNPNYESKPVNLALNPSSSYNYSNQLEASVMMNVKATGYVAIFSLSQHGKSIEEAETAMRQRTEFFTRFLKQNGIADALVFIDPVSMLPTYETELQEKKYSKTFNELPAGFEIKKNVHISFKEQSAINDLISMAAKAEIYDMVKVEYSLEDLEAVYAQLRNEAMNILLSKKMNMEKAGIFSRFVSIGEKQGSAYPAERYLQYTAAKTGMPAQFIQYRDKKPTTITYNYAEKNRTLFYDKVPDKQFDKVINPVVNEPMVQVYISIKGQFQIYDPEKDAEDKAYNKKVKDLQLKLLELDVEAKKKDIELKGKNTVQTRIEKK